MLAVTAWKHGKEPERLLDLVERAGQLKLVMAGAWLDPWIRTNFEREVRRRRLRIGWN